MCQPEKRKPDARVFGQSKSTLSGNSLPTTGDDHHVSTGQRERAGLFEDWQRTKNGFKPATALIVVSLGISVGGHGFGKHPMGCLRMRLWEIDDAGIHV